MTAPARLHPEDRAALVTELADELERRGIVPRQRPKPAPTTEPTITQAQASRARSELARLGLASPPGRVAGSRR